MKNPILYIALFVILFLACEQVSKDQLDNNFKIAIGSCYRTDFKDNTMWQEVRNTHPDLWVWLGDIVYADTEDMSIMKQKYDILKLDSAYQNLLNETSVIGIWDDHDYGQNDRGKSYSKKKESKNLLLDFVDVDKSDKVFQHEGIYTTHIYGNGNKKVKVILLDTRYFRDELLPDTLSDERYKINQTGDVLGEEQWTWLENELQKNETSIHIIASGYQIIPWEPKFEKWSNFPMARQRFFDLLVKTKPNRAFLLSGDRHISEVSKLDLEGLEYPLYEFTSSGITHTWSEVWPEENRYRVTDLIIKKSFGIINIDWNNEEPVITLEIRGHNNSIFATYKPKF